MSSLRKKLMNDVRLNAFNDAFSLEVLSREVQDAATTDGSPDDISAAAASVYFNGAYNEFYKLLSKIIKEGILTVDEIEELVLADCNRQYLIIRHQADAKMHQKIREQNGAIFTNTYRNLTIDGADKSVYVSDGLENFVDALNIVFSYLRYQPRTESVDELDEERALNALFSLVSLANQASTYKACYDGLIWQNKRAEMRGTDLYLIPLDRDLEEIIQIGKVRIDQTISNLFTEFQVSIINSPNQKLFWYNVFMTMRKERKLESVKIKNGYVLPITRKGHSDKRHIYDLNIHLSIISYYDFAEDLVLPNAAFLKIKDVALMYSELIEMVSMVEDTTPAKDTTLNYDGMYSYGFRIKEKDFKALLHLKTLYSTKQINAFIKLITHTEGRIDFWSKPFIKRQDDLLFTMLPITSSHILYLVDEWLKSGGYSLDERGPLFEKHLKGQLVQDMEGRGFFCRIHANTVKVSDDKWEEIDLIAEFKHCILVAEVKCIGYPLESRDKFNAHKRVTQGAKQLNRKVNFIKSNVARLSNSIPALNNKPIVKALITNFPLLSGLVIEGIAVSDAKFLHHYVSEGKVREGFSSMDITGAKDYKGTKLVKYYEDELTFCQNLSHYLAHPVFVDSTKKHCYWQVANTVSNLFVEYANVDFGASNHQ